MLRKLLRQNLDVCLSNHKQARLKQLKEYVCLREALNSQASERASTDFKAIATKYNLNSKQVVDLIGLLGFGTQNLHTYLRASSAANEVERLNQNYRNNSWYNNSRSLESQIAHLKAKYPEAAAYTSGQSERVRAIRELEALFVTGGPKHFVPGDDSTINRLLDVFEKNTRALIHSIESESSSQTGTDVHSGTQADREKILDSIRDSLSSLHSELHSNPADTYGLIKKYVDHNLGATHALSAEPSRRRSSEEGLIEGAKFENDEALIEQEFVGNNTDGAQLHFQPWESDKKVIYQAHDIPCDWSKILTAVGGLAGVLILYKLFQGDGTVLQFGGLALLAGYSLYRANMSTLKAGFPYLQQITAHRDGRLLDLYLKEISSNKIKVVEGVPIEDFKLHRGDHTFSDGKDNNVKLSELRAHSFGSGQWVASYGRNTIFVPQTYTGSGLELERVFGRRAGQITH